MAWKTCFAIPLWYSKHVKNLSVITDAVLLRSVHLIRIETLSTNKEGNETETITSWQVFAPSFKSKLNSELPRYEAISIGCTTEMASRC